ncbi:MAG: hypothetical protein WAW61_07060 [Methylococcaceae bacterium]
MRLIRVTDGADNVYTIDIDNETAIGIDFQVYDFKEPGKRKINISNSFTIPSTIHNLKIFGFPGNVHTKSIRFYDNWYIDYWIDNIQFIKKARLRIEQVDLQANRISLFIFEKPDIWEQFKAFLWPDFITEFLTWMRDVKGFPVLQGAEGPSWTYFNGTIAQFVDAYKDTSEGIILPHYFGNLAKYQPYGSLNFKENNKLISLYFMDVDPTFTDDTRYCEGGHFCIFAKTIFEFLEYKYSLNFHTAGGVFTANVWDDVVIKSVYTPARDICLYTVNGTEWAFFERNKILFGTGYFEPYHDIEDKPDKSLYDFIIAFIQHFNIIVEIDETETNIKLRRFDDIETFGKIVNWSGLAKKPIFKPAIDGYAQNNYIKFSAINPGGSEFLNAKLITCNNKGIDIETDLFKIDAYIPSFSISNSSPVLDIEDSFETFQFFRNSGNNINVSVYISNRVLDYEYHILSSLHIPALIDMSTEYLLLEAALQYPEFYEVEKWLSLHDMINYDPYNLYYFQEVNGLCFINKISGFNPEKSKSPTKLELIKISSKSPPPIYVTDFWTDGIADVYTDGTGDQYY